MECFIILSHTQIGANEFRINIPKDWNSRLTSCLGQRKHAEDIWTNY